MVSPDAKPEEIKQILGLAADAETNPVEISPTLVKSGSDLILIDTGTGPGMGKTSGMIAESLKASGTDPSAITKIVYTHAHPDHLWGTMTGDGKPVFANASYHIAEAELNFWTTPDLASKMPKDMEGMVKSIQAQLAAMKEKIVTFKPGTELVAGINLIDTAGHTPGHVSLELAGGDGLIVTGDAITLPQVFFAHPEWKFGFDADGDMAGKARRKLLDMAASGKKQLLGYHWAYPGLGRAEAKDSAFVYVPAS
jgi:glyoxylase-like metal-dependent hydrolase (beta-lactamase superfamily II)